MKKIKLVITSVLAIFTLFACNTQVSGGGDIIEENPFAEQLVDLEGYTLQVGDLVLNNNKVLPYSQDYTPEQWQKFNPATAVAVIFRPATNDKKALGVGLKQPATTLAWAKKGTTGYSTKFENIICIAKQNNSDVDSFSWDETIVFEEDLDGSDNWSEICNIDTEGVLNAAENYPAFDYANTYGTTAKLSGHYATNWFIPSIAEMVALYDAKETVNNVLRNLGESVQQLIEEPYWSSSQYSKDSAGASSVFTIYLSDAYTLVDDKASEYNYLCVIHTF